MDITKKITMRPAYQNLWNLNTKRATPTQKGLFYNNTKKNSTGVADIDSFGENLFNNGLAVSHICPVSSI